MKAKDLMSAPAITTRPDATVEEAADLMLRHQISCLPVLDDEGQLLGIVTHSDFGLHRKFVPLAGNLYTLLGSWATPETLEEVAHNVRNRRVNDVMTHEVATTEEDTSIAEVAELMLRRKVHRLPVLRDGKLVGVITRHDLLKLMASEQ